MNDDLQVTDTQGEQISNPAPDDVAAVAEIDAEEPFADPSAPLTNLKRVLGVELCGPDAIVDPRPRKSPGQIVFAAATDTFNAVNAKALAQITIFSALIPQVQGLLEAQMKKLRREDKQLTANLEAMKPRPKLTAGKISYVSISSVIYGVIASVGMFFIISYMIQQDPLLQYYGLSLSNILASASLVGISWVLGSLMMGIPPRLQLLLWSVIGVTGSSLFLAGLIELLAQPSAGAAMDYTARFATGSSAELATTSASPELWLALRFVGEVLVLATLKCLIHLYLKDNTAQQTRAEERLKEVRSELKIKDGQHRTVIFKREQLEVLAKTYKGRLADYVARSAC